MKNAPILFAPIDGFAINEKTSPQLNSFSTNKPALLLIEDNEDVLDYLNRMLQKDYNLFVALDGATGFKLAKEVRPDLILSDVMMPDMNGYSLCDALKAHSTTKHIPIILLTAKASPTRSTKRLKAQSRCFSDKTVSSGRVEVANTKASRKKQIADWSTS